MAKAANGTGTIRKRADGRWEGRYVSPKDGKQKSVYGKTQKEVRQKLTKKLAEINAGVYTDPVKLTLSQWIDLWLSDFSSHLKETTREWYKWTCERYIKPRLGSVKLSKLSKAQIQLALNDMEKSGLASSTVSTIRITLSSALQAAVDMEMLPMNPCRGIKRKVIRREKMNIVDREKMPSFYAAAQETRYEDLLIFAMLTGLRSGELRGLRWEDVSQANGTITVRRQLTIVHGNYVMQTPKDGEERVIHPPQSAMDLLNRHRIAQQRQRLRKGSNWINDGLSKDLVFRMPDGRFIKRNVLNNTVRRIGQKIGLPEMTPHDLRHSFAVASLRAGMDVKTLQNILGHASASTTLNYYAHYTDDMGTVAAVKLETYLKQPL